jgi:deoxycytidylate deaminase
VNAQRGFEVALAAAELSDAPRAGLRMGACLVAGARLLSVGSNRWHSHPSSENKGFNRSFHAEHCALVRRQHFDRMSGRLTLFVARRLADGTIGDSKPCSNCLALAKLAGVRKVWYYENGAQRELVL